MEPRAGRHAGGVHPEGYDIPLLAKGPRKEMLQLERNLQETLPIGPKEGESFYIQKQMEKGLKPPPYKP